MTPFLWGLVIGFVGFHLVWIIIAIVVWYRTSYKEHREPARIREDFLAMQEAAQRLRETLQQSAHDRRN